MKNSFLLNGKEILFRDITSVKGNSVQEEATLELIRHWLSGRTYFDAVTSGSTGKPKNITFTREKIELSVGKTLSYFGLSKNDHAFVCMNPAFIAGKMMIFRALKGEMSLTVEEASGMPDLTGGAYTFTAVTPMQLQNFLSENDLNALGNFKCILVGGAPVTPKLETILAGTDYSIYETFGMTETLSHVAVRKLTSGGTNDFQCIHEVELGVDDRDCLRIKGDITDNEWLQTNDRIVLTGLKSFQWLGRADWIINSGGIKLQPERIEDKIGKLFNKNNWTNRFFIHGFPHPALGEAAVLIIEGAELPTGSERQIQECLGKFEIPKKIIATPEFILGENNKILRKETASLLPVLTF